MLVVKYEYHCNEGSAQGTCFPKTMVELRLILVDGVATVVTSRSTPPNYRSPIHLSVKPLRLRFLFRLQFCNRSGCSFQEPPSAICKSEHEMSEAVSQQASAAGGAGSTVHKESPAGEIYTAISLSRNQNRVAVSSWRSPRILPFVRNLAGRTFTQVQCTVPS
jgi:hypothetical protein